MEQKYIRINKTNDVIYLHYKPFHPRHGLKKSKEELELTGILIDEIPEPEIESNQIANLKFNPDTNTLYYEYVDLPEEPNTNNSQNQLDEIQEVLNILLGED